MELDRAALEQSKVELKTVLKAWEGRFKTENGRKAGREDIKANPEIALKYKEYQRVQDLLSGKIPTRKPSPKRERSNDDVPDSPSKRRRSLHDTPQKRKSAAPVLLQQPVAQEQSEEYLQTPALKRTFIGPTPQRNGTVLGIFDSPPAVLAATPSRKDSRTVLGDLDANAAVTPSQPKQGAEKIKESPEAQYEERARGSRTPASTGKRFMLDAFMTPSHNRRVGVHDENHLALQATPSSAIKTPAFLRRDNFSMGTAMNAITEEEDTGPTSPQMMRQQLPWQRRGFGRSLSGMIRDMRKEQEAREDEELDLLREMEDEAAGVPVVAKRAPPKIVVQDSQAGLDRDGFVPSDVEREESDAGEDETQVGPDGKPRKPWKKKGLKRQTRRVNMRPIAKKVQAQPERPGAEDDGDGDVVTETQAPQDMPSDLETGSDDEYSENSKTATTAAKAKDKLTSTTEKNAPAKRKVKPEAHANYRALKIKNKNSKGKGGGRFGRRR